MLFNSLDFAIFLPIVFILYWFVTKNNLRIQNLLLLVSSYVFYGWWDWRFLGLIIFSSFVDYTIGLKLNETNNTRKRKGLLIISLIINLGFLGFFKYYNFFIDSFTDSFLFFGKELSASRLNIILPVGISFYTFQTLSYTIDVYRKKLEPTKNIVSFFSFVSFFPQLVAGPIERASNLLPQFYKKRIFDKNMAIDGMRQILWGLVKKIIIADNCAEQVNIIFSNSSELPAGVLVLGAIFFSFQIYGDFSGYSDIAIGISRLLGFNLMQNFAFPYFSRNIAEFWRRWHISLSTWFRDYLYIPLGGSRVNKTIALRNTIIIFTISGFWHGANWTFIAWGMLNALYFIPSLLTAKNRKYLDIVAMGKRFPTMKEFLMIANTFILTTLGWIFFRAENITHALQYIRDIFTFDRWQSFQNIYSETICLIILFTIFEWIGRSGKHALEKIYYIPTTYRWVVYILLTLSIFIFSGKHQEFIYFQF